MSKLVALCSGGLDSVTMVHYLQEDFDLLVLNILYGQRHIKEAKYARACAERLGLPYKRVSLVGAYSRSGPSALTNPKVEVPKGRYSEESIGTTVVPNRNAVFANIAAAVAIDTGADGIALAVHEGDHAIYVDCRPIFVEALKQFLQVSTGQEVKVAAPFLDWSKGSIVALGYALQVPYEETWSCYKGGTYHCGKCSTCFERKWAFRKANVEDPTIYEE